MLEKGNLIITISLDVYFIYNLVNIKFNTIQYTHAIFSLNFQSKLS